MILAQVIGTVWGAKQSEGLSGRRVVEVRPVHLRGAAPGTSLTADCGPQRLEHRTLLAVDPLGADAGQLVLVSIGSRVRDLTLGAHVPTKNCVIAIVDEASIDPVGRAAGGQVTP